MTPPSHFNLHTHTHALTHTQLHSEHTPPPIIMDHSRFIILFQSIGSVHVFERDVDGLWAALIAGNQSGVVSLS